jgi:hypothetical protein
MTACTLALTPSGRLTLVPAADAPPVPAPLASRLLADSALGPGPLLLGLGAGQVGVALPPALAWWRDLAVRYLSTLCTLPEAAEHQTEQPAGRVRPPDAGELQALSWSAPPMPGAEYLSAEVLQQHWQALDAALRAALQAEGLPLGAFLKRHNPAWHLVGRVHLHLAENRKDEECPFAFLATYTTRLSAQGKAQHRPLGEALREYAAAADKERLLALLAPLQRAAQACPWLKTTWVRCSGWIWKGMARLCPQQRRRPRQLHPSRPHPRRPERRPLRARPSQPLPSRSRHPGPLRPHARRAARWRWPATRRRACGRRCARPAGWTTPPPTPPPGWTPKPCARCSGNWWPKAMPRCKGGDAVRCTWPDERS